MPRRLAVVGDGEVGVIEYQEAPVEGNMVLVRTELASGKHGTTTAMFDGAVFRGQTFDQQMRLFVESPPESARKEERKSQPGSTGTMGAGKVIEVGSEVRRWKKGDRVFGPMDVRETNLVHEDRLYELGDLDPRLALCAEPAYVSFHCVRESNVRYGDSVAVIGLGAIGLLAVRIAREAGAEHVFAVDLYEKRRAWALQNGADAAFDPREGDPAVAVHRATGNRGVDVAIEVSGSYAALNTAMRCARLCGTVCSAGFYQGEAKAMHMGREWHHNRLNMIVPHGCGWGHPPRDYPGWDNKRAYDTIVSMMRKERMNAHGLLDPVVSLDEAPGVWRQIVQDPAKVIKFAVRF